MWSEILILGDGGHASCVAEAANSMGFAVTKCLALSREDETFQATTKEIEQLDLGKIALALGIGHNFARQSLYNHLTSIFSQAHFPNIVHATAWVSPSAAIDQGTVVLAYGSVGPQAVLRTGSLLNTGASLDHDSTLGEFAALGPGARTGGNVTIGPRTMIGLQAGILQGRIVGEDSVVGAQSLVLEDIPSLSVAVGSPSRVIRSRERDERYY